MERELLDLEDELLREWNTDLLVSFHFFNIIYSPPRPRCATFEAPAVVRSSRTCPWMMIMTTVIMMIVVVITIMMLNTPH
jgi:hypothetical protein